MSSGKTFDPLQDYFDSLLSDVQPGVINRFAEAKIREDESALKLAASGNVAALSSAPRPARAVTARPFAEPVRTLNLRMPLPPIAPLVVAERAPVVETKQQIAIEKPVEAKQWVESKSLIESRSLDLIPPAPVAKTALAESNTKTQVGAANFSEMAPPAAWLSNGRPQWAQQSFECLIFKAGNLQLAAPLVELGSIYPLDANALTEIFGQTHWFMGLLPVKEYNIRAIDTALVVMPERYNSAMRSNYRYVVSLFGSDWGLAVDSVVGTVMLDPERIRWRGERSKRPWLAGTLIEQMCALFDIAQLAWLFHNQDHKRTPM